MILSQLVDPIFGRYAVLLSVIAGVLELVPIIGPIISAVPAVLLAATAGVEAVVAALAMYTAIQQVENNFLVPKIQGDAVELHPAAVMFAILIGGALGGLLGAILALPVAAAIRDVVRYLFHRSGHDDPGALARLIDQVGMRPRGLARATIGDGQCLTRSIPTGRCRWPRSPAMPQSRPPTDVWRASIIRMWPQDRKPAG